MIKKQKNKRNTKRYLKDEFKNEKYSLTYSPTNVVGGARYKHLV